MDCRSVYVYTEEVILSSFLYTTHLYFSGIRTSSMFTLLYKKYARFTALTLFCRGCDDNTLPERIVLYGVFPNLDNALILNVYCDENTGAWRAGDPIARWDLGIKPANLNWLTVKKKSSFMNSRFRLKGQNLHFGLENHSTSNNICFIRMQKSGQILGTLYGCVHGP